MIPIRHDRLEEFADKHYSATISFLQGLQRPRKKYRIDAINKVIEKIFGNNQSLESLIFASPEAMEKLVEKWHQSHHDVFSYFSSTLYKRFRSDKEWLYGAPQLFSDLDIKVCPYCNENFTFNLNDLGESNYEIDHFFPQSKYPFLAISFYNLIPSCKTCNYFKSDDWNTNSCNLLINPYDRRIDEIINFEFEIQNSSFYYQTDSLDIDLKVSQKNNFWQKRIKNHKAAFFLDSRYSHHKDIALEIIQRKYAYSEDYLKSLFQMYEGSLFSSREDLERIVHSNYIDESNFSKRPLSKLTSDLLRQLEE